MKAFGVLRSLLAVACCAILPLSAAPPSSIDAPQLAVMFAATEADGTTAEQALALLQGPGTKFENQRFWALSGRPIGARFLLATRLSPDARQALRPGNALGELHRWLILDYASVFDAALAHTTMAANPSVFKHSRQSIFGGGLSATPTDPFFTYNAAPVGTQVAGTSSAAAYGLLRIPEAWDLTNGHAYVGMLDNGVESTDVLNGITGFHRDLRTNMRAHLSWRMIGHASDVDEPAHPAVVNGISYDARGHGTHVGGLLAASPNNANGTSGVCWNCSLGVIAYGPSTSDSEFGASISEAVMQGLQVINWSGGFKGDTAYFNTYCSNQVPAPPVCLALTLASDHDISFIAASGNSPEMPTPRTQFPAREPSVISVGSSNAAGTLSSFSATGKVDFIAPGERILSTFYSGKSWYITEAYGAGTGTTCQRQSGNETDDLFRYGYCSGTSMATPIVAGSYALVRSANPLLSTASVTALLRQFASRASSPDATTVGHGAPNVFATVKAALWGPNGNSGLTPLFSMYVPGASPRHFYTTAPQMAAAANCAALKVGRNGWLPYDWYRASNLLESSDGTPVAGYAAFPGACYGGPPAAPTASVKVFTTPTRLQQNLVPLYRLSFNSEANPPNFVSGPTRSPSGRHAYATLEHDVLVFEYVGYVKDGIEGYLYSPDAPQPPGTVALHRRYKASTDDYGLFPANLLATAGAGYLPAEGYQDVIGYACPNTTNQSGVCRSIADVGLTQSASANPSAGKDVILTLTLSNAGPGIASGATITDTLGSGLGFVWATPGCAYASGTVTCNVSPLAAGSSVQVKVVVRTSAAGSFNSSANVVIAEHDPSTTNNSVSVVIAVGASPAASIVNRYRLSNQITHEHMYTSDLNEYNALGAQSAWNQEGVMGNVLNNPGSFNGMMAVPYYRLYNTSSLMHHWTKDANEYYTLIQFPGWNGEGANEFILPTATTGAKKLYRLVNTGAPWHLWTADANEYNVLNGNGWAGETTSEYLIQ